MDQIHRPQTQIPYTDHTHRSHIRYKRQHKTDNSTLRPETAGLVQSFGPIRVSLWPGDGQVIDQKTSLTLQPCTYGKSSGLFSDNGMTLMLAIFSGQFYPLPDLHHYHRRSCPLQTLLSLGTAARKALDLRTYVCLLRYPPHRVFNVLPVFLLVGPRHFHKNIVVLSKLCGVHRFGGRFQVCTGSKVKKKYFSQREHDQHLHLTTFVEEKRDSYGYARRDKTLVPDININIKGPWHCYGLGSVTGLPPINNRSKLVQVSSFFEFLIINKSTHVTHPPPQLTPLELGSIYFYVT